MENYGKELILDLHNGHLKTIKLMEAQMNFINWQNSNFEKPGRADGFKILSPKVEVKTPLGEGVGYYNSVDNDWLIDINGEEFQAYKEVTHWRFIADLPHLLNITDDDIVSYFIKQRNNDFDLTDHDWNLTWNGKIEGAKAMRDGLIKSKTEK